jgi:TPR repeat protein
MTHENPTTEPSDPADRPADHTGAGSNSEKSAVSAPAKKSSPIPTSDARLAEQGDAFAQYRLGKYYAKQNGRQAPESVSWYKKASTGLRRLAEAGNGQAMYVLGVMYAYGRGVARNTEEARRWLTQAVQHNVTAAQPVLAGLEAKQAADPKQKGGGPVQNATPQKSLKRDR